ncbi:hypothetical protein BGW38_006084 [Lunasporangiospora selenospora]|uniref:GDP-fucose protein O-fucosyltransferase 2 n=1 Tax=Lunasporangiospora selenospora TaxID=979761 RepID=A0A9P6FZY3_9FUNG|nr:hypothetical protein BGW38_006084 [Lunasporangiospora selenospora]
MRVAIEPGNTPANEHPFSGPGSQRTTVKRDATAEGSGEQDRVEALVKKDQGSDASSRTERADDGLSLDEEILKALLDGTRQPTVKTYPVDPEVIDGAEDEPNPDPIPDVEYKGSPGDNGAYAYQQQLREVLANSQSVGSKDPFHDFAEQPHQSQQSKQESARQNWTDPGRYLMVDLRLEMGIGEVRGALEHALYASHLTGRTLVLPQFLYFRGCYNPIFCQRATDKVQLDAVYIKNNNRTLRPVTRWPIPLEQIYDLERIKRYADVIMVDDWVQRMISEDVQLAREQDAASANTSGLAWLREHRQYEYHAWRHNELLKQFSNVTVHERNVHSFLYHSINFVVDTVFKGPNSEDDISASSQATVYGHHEFPSRNMNGTGRWTIKDARITGFKETFQDLDERVLYLRGGITEYGKQMLRFSTMEARDAFEDVTTNWVQPSLRIRHAASYLCRNLLKKTNGRTYLGVHFRRGKDFLESYIPNTIGRMNQYRMGLGTRDPRTVLLRINMVLGMDTTVGLFRHEELDEWTAQDQDQSQDKNQGQDGKNKMTKSDGSDKPQQGSGPSVEARDAGQTQFMSGSLRESHFFLATDERDPAVLGQMKDQGAIVIGDLMDEDFIVQNLDWIGFPDFFAYLDQLICVKARMFLGSPMSVFSGAIINQRIGHQRKGRGGNGWLYRNVPLIRNS